MRTVKLSRQALNQWVAGLIRTQKVVGVQAKDDRFEFAPLRRSSDLRLDYDVTILPPKMFFQPAREPLLAFDGAAGFKTLLADDPFVLLGVHPYDLAAILQMDTLFAADNDDVHYRSRREKAVIVACDVQTASPNGFAGCMGTAAVSQGFDVLLTRVADVYVAEAGTAAGAALMAALAKAPEADAVVIITEWNEFRLLDLKRLKSLMKRPNRGCPTSQACIRSDDLANMNAASSNGPVVGMSGKNTPTIPTPRKATPSTK